MQRYFLSEILKTSEVPLADLVKIIQDRSIAPQWEQMALPNGTSGSVLSLRKRRCVNHAWLLYRFRVRLANSRFTGRSLAACKHQFGLLTNRVSSFLAPPGSTAQLSSSAKASGKRSSIGQPAPIGGDVPLQPQQYQFAPINEPSNPAAFQGAPYNPQDTVDKSGKKRGRPSKQERELREAEARARGEVYQPTKRKPKARPSMEGPEIEQAGKISPSTQKVKKRRVEEVASIQPLESHAAFGSKPQPAYGEQLQADALKGRARSTIPETQPSDFQATDSLLAGMQEQVMGDDTTKSLIQPSAALSQTETAPSSTTLQQGSTPREPTSEAQMEPFPTSRVSGGPPEAKMFPD